MATDAEDVIVIHELIARRIADPTIDLVRPLINLANESADPAMSLVVIAALAISELATMLTQTHGPVEAKRIMDEISVGTEVNQIFNPRDPS